METFILTILGDKGDKEVDFCILGDKEVDLEGARGASLFCNHLVFCDHFEELQTVFTAVKLIINNAPLTYV